MSYYFHEKSAFVAIITQAAQELAQRMRQYSKRQAELWKQVPSLALEADGRSGYSDQYSRAYYHRFWAINSSVNLGMQGCYTVFVDLNSGDLVDSCEGDAEPASDDRLLFLALHLDELDARKVTDSLKAHIADSSTFSGSMTREQRDKLRRELDLSPVAI